jgi:GT2 family glycosyltransferase/glycosyltransferase involved in cell wall biosynthesis
VTIPPIKATVIILVQRDAMQVVAAVRALSLATSAKLSFETIVLLNGADDATVADVQRGVRAAEVITSVANLGFGGGCNFAASTARSEYLVFLNDDTLVDPGWLEALVECADSDESIAAVGSRIRFPDGTLQEVGSILWSDGSTAPIGRGLPAGSSAYRFRRNVTYASACALLVRRTDFERVGGFDEAFFPAYYEDVDLCLRLAAIGKRITYEPNAEVVHFESRSSTSAFKSHLFRRNQRRFAEKWKGTLRSFEQPSSTLSAVERSIDAAWGKRSNVLVIDDRLPDAGLGSGYGRMMEMIADLEHTSFRVHFYATAQTDGDVRNIGRFGVGVIARPLSEELSDSHRRYDLAIISRPHNYERVVQLIRELQPACSICYDVESLFYRRIERQALIESDDKVRANLVLEAEAARRFETRIACEVDHLVCISTDERSILESVPGHAPIDFIVPVARRIDVTTRKFAEREPLAILVAGWMAGPNSPNADGLRWFAERVIPLLRARVPYAKVAVTGANPPPSLLKYASGALEFVGYVPDLSALYSRARVALSPLRFGAGVKIKTVEAIQYGVPVVATSVGAEGLDITCHEAVNIADDEEVFAHLVAGLLTEHEAWERSHEAARRQMQSWFEAQTRNWADVCESILARTESGAARFTISLLEESGSVAGAR